MATIDYHQFNCNLRKLTEDHLDQLIQILGLEHSRFEKKRNYKTKELIWLRFAYPEESCSVFIKVGRFDRAHHPPAYVNSRIEIHGNFFDRSPTFSLAELVPFLVETGCFDPTQLDVGFMDTDHVTTWDDWTRVAIDWRLYFTGSILTKETVTRVVSGDETQKIHIGNLASKTAHAVVYRRNDGTVRLEIRYRNAGKIREALKPFVAEPDFPDWDKVQMENTSDPDATAIEMLIRHLDIVTLASREEMKRSKRGARYIRETFFEAFLASAARKPGKVARKRERERKLTDSANTAVKALAGRINNFVRSVGWTPEEVAAAVNQYLVNLQLSVPPCYITNDHTANVENTTT